MKKFGKRTASVLTAAFAAACMVTLFCGTAFADEICTGYFFPDAGTGEEFQIQCPKGGTITMPECPFTPPEGQRFTVWDIGAHLRPGEQATLNTDAMIYAMYGYELRYEANGGTGEVPETVTYGPMGLITLPECMITAPAGMEFDYWDVNGTTYHPAEIYQIMSDTVIMPMWRKKEIRNLPDRVETEDFQRGSSRLGTVRVPEELEEIPPKGWLKEHRGWRYVDDELQEAKHRWIHDRNKWYWINDEGLMSTGWQLVNSKWYFLGNDGAMETGWKEDNGKTYYLEEDGSMATGWKAIDGKWYYFQEDGSMVTGWKEIDGKLYYFGEDGSMTDGTRGRSGESYPVNVHRTVR